MPALYHPDLERVELGRAERVIRSAREWMTLTYGRGRTDAQLLVHKGERLSSAEELLKREDMAGMFGPAEINYLAACRKQETKEKGARRSRIVFLVAACVLAVLTVSAFAAGGFAWFLRGVAEAQRAEADAQRQEANLQRQIAARNEEMARINQAVADRKIQDLERQLEALSSAEVPH